MKCDIYCRLTTAQLRMERGELLPAAELLAEVEELLHRAIECGALVDPWNILGFGGQYSLFPAPENSVYDQRVDELIGHGRRGSSPSTCRSRRRRPPPGCPPCKRPCRGGWRCWPTGGTKFATHGGRLGGRDFRPADRASRPTTWPPRCGPGTRRARRPATWPSGAITPSSSARPRPTPWSSTPSWSIAIRWPRWRCWCSGSASPTKFPLVEEDVFLSRPDAGLDGGVVGRRRRGRGRRPPPPPDRWALTRKFLDYLEANAEEYWEVPQFELAAAAPRPANPRGTGDDEDEDDIFQRRLRGDDLSRQHRRRLRRRNARRRARTRPTSSSSRRPSGSSGG